MHDHAHIAHTPDTPHDDHDLAHDHVHDDDDPYDLFDSALSTIFDIPPIAFSAQPGSFHTYTPPISQPSTSPSPPPIQLAIPNPPAALHKTLQANHLWLSAVRLADRIYSDLLLSLPPNARIAELGAGAGLPGVAAAAAHPGLRVVSTDWGVPEVLDVIASNFERVAPHQRGSRWDVVGLQWGADPAGVLAALGGGRFDALLLADTLWVTDAHSALLDSIQALLSPGGTAYVAAGLHTGRGPVERFIHAATERGATVTATEECRWERGEWAPHTPSPGLEEERGVVVSFSLNWKWDA